MKQCRKCDKEKPLDHFRVVTGTGKHHSWCQKCESKYHKERRAGTQIAVIPTTSDAVNPKDAKEIAMKRMLSGAKQRAKDKGLMFDLHYEDVQIPNICPILRIPLIPSVDGTHNDNSPSLDRCIPYLGYTRGNVKVISMKANRIKTDANSNEIAAVLNYVLKIEEENT
tara:strand:+ start:5484 stop:5987 length:504 start_codon:yes stop_codon:yes gene_type:complete